ncbi:MAG: serine protease, partial [bacterium]|nr:serine protease [bacterium]
MEFFNSFLQWLVALIVGAVTWIVLAGSAFGPQIVTQAPVPLPPPKQNVASTSPTTATTTSIKKTGVPTQTKTPAPVPPPPLAGQAAPSSPPVVITNDLIAQVNTQTRPSLVNILCNLRTANTSSYISGSGLLVDPRGVVLTNAHVAQFFLLQKNPAPNTTSCTVRTGSPAVAAYTAQLLYLPPLWIAANVSQILSASPLGTGERDYALLYITGATQFASPLPSSFPALVLSIESPKQNDPVLLAGYPAGFLDANGVQKSLYISSAVSAIEQLYT